MITSRLWATKLIAPQDYLGKYLFGVTNLYAANATVNTSSSHTPASGTVGSTNTSTPNTKSYAFRLTNPSPQLATAADHTATTTTPLVTQQPPLAIANTSHDTDTASVSSFHSAESGPPTLDLGVLNLSVTGAAPTTLNTENSDAAWAPLLSRLNALRAGEGEQGRRARVLRLLEAAVELAEGE